jgi:ferredoxin
MEMIRRIIKIDEKACNGCGLCADACHEGAIEIANGKAKLRRDDYCDGLGNCLPVCPTGAITFEEREAQEYDEKAVKAKSEAASLPQAPLPCGCPGSNARSLERENRPMGQEITATASELRQWPVQIKLVPVNAPYFEAAHLLIAADCSAYSRANFHQEFMRDKITLIGCPKLDDTDYSHKIAEIISRNDIKSVTVVRLEVPCCGGIEYAVETALQKSGKKLPWRVVTLSTSGEILKN